MSATGIGREERLLTSRLIQHVNDWSHDGHDLVFAMLDPKTQWDLWLLPVKGSAPATTRTPATLLHGPFNEYNAQVSPDGNWIAYQSDESGVWEILLFGRSTPRPAVRQGRYRAGEPSGRCGAETGESCSISPTTAA